MLLSAADRPTGMKSTEYSLNFYWERSAPYSRDPAFKSLIREFPIWDFKILLRKARKNSYDSPDFWVCVLKLYC